MNMLHHYFEHSDFDSGLPQEKTHAAGHESDTASEGGILQTIRDMTSLASMMRIGGAVTVIAAMSSFLMQGWADGNDMSRYYLLLSQTLVLALAGFGLSYGMKENKGARVFFGLGLIAITVNMTTLGALIFSTTQWGSTLVQYPGFAKWQAADMGSLVMAFGATLLVSAPVALFSKMVLARRSAHILAALFLLTNLTLLLPVRESLLVGIVAIIAVLVPLWFVRERMYQDATLRTPEGRFAVATLFIPAAIIILRSLWLYPTDALLMLMLSGMAYTGFRLCSAQMQERTGLRTILNWFSLGAAFVVAESAAELALPVLGYAVAPVAFGATFAAALYDIGQRSNHRPLHIRLAAVTLSLSTISPLIYSDALISPVLCIIAGAGLIALGRHHGLRNVLVLGGITIFAGMVEQLHDIVSVIDFSNWVTLAITGASAIIGASLIERHGAVIKLKWERLGKPANDDHIQQHEAA